MFNLEVHNADTAPEGSRALLASLQSQVGFIPNLAGAMSHSPALLGAFLGTRGAYQGAAALSPVERELVALAVAVDCEAPYPIAAHSAFALHAGASPADVAAVREGRLPADACAAILVTTARRLVSSRGRLTADDAAMFIEAGFAPSQALDVATGVGMTTLAAMAAHLTQPPIDAAFSAQAP